MRYRKICLGRVGTITLTLAFVFLDLDHTFGYESLKEYVQQTWWTLKKGIPLRTGDWAHLSSRTVHIYWAWASTKICGEVWWNLFPTHDLERSVWWVYLSHIWALGSCCDVNTIVYAPIPKSDCFNRGKVILLLLDSWYKTCMTCLSNVYIFALINGRNWREVYLIALSSRKLLCRVASRGVHLPWVMWISRYASAPNKDASVINWWVRLDKKNSYTDVLRVFLPIKAVPHKDG